MMRAVYHDNPNLVAEFSSSVTEKELQLEGGDFNKWDSFTHQYYTEKIEYTFLFWTIDCGGGTYLSRDYYNNQPTYIWAVNSMKTMPQTTTPNFTINISSIHYETGETQTYKVFPTVTKYIVDLASRNNAAQIATIHVCNMATEGDDGTETWGSIGSALSVDREAFYAAGEICTGSSDAKGNLSYDGYAFESRPSKMTVRYRYDSYNSETGYMKFELRSGNDVIAVHEYKPEAASDWTEYTFDVPYSSTTKKATSVCVTFKSTSASSPAYKGNEARTLTVDGADYNVHSGSVLWIDDVRFIYE